MVVRTRWVLVLSIGLPVTFVAAIAWLVMFHDARKNIDLAEWAEPQDSWTRSMMPGAHWATDELCTRDFPCIQAVESETLTMYRFEDREMAVAVAEAFGENGYLTGWIAVRYQPGALTEAQRTDFEYGISCINTWVGEEGQDC